MMRFTLLAVLLFVTTHSHAESAGSEGVTVPRKATPFPSGRVKLLDGPFKNSQDLAAKRLLELEPDRLLARYRSEAGLKPKAEGYGGWEAQGVSGHSLGHYLSGCARMYRLTGDEEFQKRVTYIVGELAECQEAHGNGFLGAIPDWKRVFGEISRGEIRSAGFDLNGSWVPWYTLHKQFAGLIDAYEIGGNEQALEVARKLADWTGETTRQLNHDQWQRMLACEHGGMNEVLADLYAITGEPAYLELAKKFYHEGVLKALAEERDELAGKHANTQIPKAIGAARIYEVTGDERFGKISSFFWDTVLENHTYATGGNSDGEHFGEPKKLNDRLGANTTETCNTYNMLKLTKALFCRSPEARYADYMERALWNHMLASQHPVDGRVCYYLTLRPGNEKSFLDPLAFTCCNGSGMESHARHVDYIFFKSDDSLWVNQFVASEADWNEKGVQVRQETKFPAEQSTKLTIHCEAPTAFKLSVRHPHWIGGSLDVKVNGKAIQIDSKPTSYATIDRMWEDGDVVEVALPTKLRTESMPDNPKRIATFVGPILLAGDLGEKEGRIPVLVAGGETVEQWLTSKSPETLEYKTKSVGRPVDVLLKPFYAIHDTRHTVYWDLFSEEQWREQESEYRAEQERLKALEARTVDVLAIGEMQPERDHNVQGEKTSVGEHNGKKWRHAADGGWFSCELNASTEEALDLQLTFWGGETGPRTFDILVDGEKIATQTLANDAPGKFFDKTYPLPEALTRGKQKIDLKFQAHPGNFAGGVFGVRLLKGEREP